MLSKQATRYVKVTLALVAGMILFWTSLNASAAQENPEAGASSHTAIHWETPACEHRALWTEVHGTLTITGDGLDFRSTAGKDRHWSFEDIRSAFLAPHRLKVESYVNRSWHRPGTRHSTFDLATSLPPKMAAAVASRIARPLQNADPDPGARALATISVRHRTLTRGTNGVLRFREGGIDYITKSNKDSRSWRWTDLQALSMPDRYQLFLFGYLDTYTFDLKEPLPRTLFKHATDAIYAHSEALPTNAPGTTLATQAQKMGERQP